MPISRTYLCDDCQGQFNRLHWDRDEPVPECPYCASDAARNIPGTFNITGARAKAIDIAQQIAEEDYGLTNMRDNLREGDIAAMGPSAPQTAEREELVREMQATFGEAAGTPERLEQNIKEFWHTGGSKTSLPPEAQMARDQKVAEARMASTVARTDGADPIELLHKAEKAANPHGGMNLHVMSRSKLN